MATKNRAVLVFINDEKILLMYRLKDGEEYYVFPGGGVEEGETVEQAAVREAKEETGLDVVIDKKLWEHVNGDRTEHFYLINKFSGDMKIGGPEENRQSDTNVYRLEWVPMSDLDGMKLLPEVMKKRILEELL